MDWVTSQTIEHIHTKVIVHMQLFTSGQKSNITEVDAEAAHLCFYLKRH